MIDLQQFCSTEESRYYLMKPWSRGNFTWATDGHVLIRVARRDGVEEQPKAPDAARIFTPDCETVAVLGLPNVIWPSDPPPIECEACDGRGTRHECPDCMCKCDDCDGSGKLTVYASVSIRGGIFNASYVRKIATLPWVEFAERVEGERAVFRFEGGAGLIATRRGEAKHHLGDIETLKRVGK
jgi:hypothetical protein